MLGISHILSGVLVIFTIIILGLTAYVANALGSHSPDSNNFLIFCTVWTFIVLAYLLVARRLPFFNKFIPLGVLAVTTIFWFAGAVAAAAHLGVPRCHGSVCRSFQAAIAFSFFNWAIFTGLTGLEALETRRGTTSAGVSGPAPYPQA